MTLISGFRWYREFPSQLTQVLVASNASLFTGGDPNSTYPYATISAIQTFTSQNASTPVSFAPVRDPAAASGSGSDVVVICGFTGPYGFATASVTIGTFAAGDTFALKAINGGTTVTSSSYTVLQTDTTTTIAQNLVTLMNESAAVAPGTPFLGQCYSVGGTVYAGALLSGTAGNAYTIQIIRNGSGVGSPTTFAGGGASSSAPLKYDGSTVSGLSYQITRAFAGCVSWHDHVWYWGDPNAPDTLFASDINQPEGWTFMTVNGGYDMGVGDGDPGIRAVVPIGNILYVFKSRGIFAVTGYDFQSGEYQFQVQPAIRGQGTPSPQCVAPLNNAILFWDGRRFCRLSVGADETEHVGDMIPYHEGLVASGNASLIRSVAGSFAAKTSLNESFSVLSQTSPIYEMFDSVALFAVDVGDGKPDTVLVYDETASTFLGQHAWSVWSGFNVGAWIPFGQGPSAAGAYSELPLLCWIDANSYSSPNVYAYGTDPAADSGKAIPWVAQTGWITMSTGALLKNLHRVLLELEATPGVQISFTLTPSVVADQSGNPQIYDPVQGAFAATGGASGAEAHQTMIAAIDPALKADAYVIGFGESSGTATYELVGVTLDYIEEAFLP